MPCLTRPQQYPIDVGSIDMLLQVHIRQSISKRRLMKIPSNRV